MRWRTSLRAAEAAVVMGDGLLPPYITATIVNACNSAAAIVLVAVSLPEVGGGWGGDGGGGFPPPGSERGFLLRLLRQVRSPGGPGPLTAVLTHPSPGPTSAAAPARRCHRSAEGPHPGVHFTPLAIVNNRLDRQTSGQ